MSDHENEPQDDADDPRELSEQELDDVTGGSCVEMNPGQNIP